MAKADFYQGTLDFPSLHLWGREDFFVSPSNKAAVGMIDALSEQLPALLIVGAKGCGKTHLAHVFQESVFKKFRESAPMVQGEGLSLSSVGGMLEKSRFAVVEDVGKNIDEEALFHLMNGVRNKRGVLLMTARENYPAWGIRLPDLLSRLSATPRAEIGMPDDTLMSAVWVKFFAERRLNISPEAVSFLLKNAERSFGFASLVAAAADKKALSEKRGITIPLLKEVLNGM